MPPRRLSPGLGLVVASWASAVGAAPSLRAVSDQRGDFLLVGNTLGQDCREAIPAPLGGGVTDCGVGTEDSAQDVFWAADLRTGEATASVGIAPTEALSAAMLSLPEGAEVTQAWLYWGARHAAGVADEAATLVVPGGVEIAVPALDAAVVWLGEEAYYQAVGEVTAAVRDGGGGVYAVTGVAAADARDQSWHAAYAGWALVVWYGHPAAPLRNLALYDGLTAVESGATVALSLTGFRAADAALEAKLGVLAYEGDPGSTGDSLRLGRAPLTMADALSDSTTPTPDFFNGSRSWFGSSATSAEDLPWLAGGEGSLSGLDLDVVDISDRLTLGQTSVDLAATSSGDFFLLGALVTSIDTQRPELVFTKSASDLDGGRLEPGDLLEFLLTVTNVGSDAAVGVVLRDELALELEPVPGSLVGGGRSLTDAAGDDAGEVGDGVVTVWLGSDAAAGLGGRLESGATAEVRFRARVASGARGVVENTAWVTASGASGSSLETVPSDGDEATPGAQPTRVLVTEPASTGAGGDGGAAGNAAGAGGSLEFDGTGGVGPGGRAGAGGDGGVDGATGSAGAGGAAPAWGAETGGAKAGAPWAPVPAPSLRGSGLHCAFDGVRAASGGLPAAVLTLLGLAAARRRRSRVRHPRGRRS